VGSANLLMIRSGGLAFYDLRRPSAMFQYSPVRGSCFVNTIAAGGLVLVPDGSSTCSCAYSCRTSLALAPSSQQNYWGVYRRLSRVSPASPLRRPRVNFGAPGDRTDEEGHIWFSWPRPSTRGPKGAGGMNRFPTIVLPIEVQSPGDSIRRYARNPDGTSFRGKPRPWLYSSGFRGPIAFRINPGGDPEKDRTCLLSLHFGMPPGETGQRSCQVKIQGKTVIRELDGRGAAGPEGVSFVRQVRVKASSKLTIEFDELTKNIPLPVICGLDLKVIGDPKTGPDKAQGHPDGQPGREKP
jgi:hypothetical protein